MKKKEGTIIQTYNDEKRQYEYFVKGIDVTESMEILLKAHKDEYDKRRHFFDKLKGRLEAEVDHREEIDKIKEQLTKKETDLALALNEIDTLKYRLKIALEHNETMWKHCNDNYKETSQTENNLLDKIVDRFISCYVDSKTFGDLFNDYMTYLDSLFHKTDNSTKEEVKNTNGDVIHSRIEELEDLSGYLRRQIMLTTIYSTDLENAEAKGCNDVIHELIDKIDERIKVLKGDVNE